MQIDNIRIEPWIPTVRRTTLMLMLACFGIGILIGSLTAEKNVATQDRLTTAVDPATSSSLAKDGGRPSREPENRPSRASNAQEDASDTARSPAALPSSAKGSSREPENRLSRASNGREDAFDTATPPAPLLNPGTANEYQVRHKHEPRRARMISGRQLDRRSPDESSERVERRRPARDYRDLRNQMLNQQSTPGAAVFNSKGRAGSVSPSW